MNAIRKHVARVLLIVVALVGLTVGTGCDDFSLTAFRDAAAGGITEGASVLVEGVLTGFFAGLDPEGEAAADGG